MKECTQKEPEEKFVDEELIEIAVAAAVAANVDDGGEKECVVKRL